MKWLHNLLKGASLTGALFVFQACYGTPYDARYDTPGMAPMTFTLVDHATGKPLEGIHVQGKEVSRGSFQNLGITGTDGTCRVQIPYLKNQEGPFLRFEDTQGNFVVKDTTLADLRDRNILVKLDSSL